MQKLEASLTLNLPLGDGEGTGVVEGGYGEDIAVLDTGYFLSQIILSVVMGELVEVTAAPQGSYSVEKCCLTFGLRFSSQLQG